MLRNLRLPSPHIDVTEFTALPDSVAFKDMTPKSDPNIADPVDPEIQTSVHR